MMLSCREDQENRRNSFFSIETLKDVLDFVLSINFFILKYILGISTNLYFIKNVKNKKKTILKNSKSMLAINLVYLHLQKNKEITNKKEEDKFILSIRRLR